MEALNSADTTANMKSLAIYLLDYGAACQRHFSYNTGDPANKLVTDAHRTQYP